MFAFLAPLIGPILGWLIPSAATTFLGRYWKLIAIGVAVLIIVGLVGLAWIFKLERDAARDRAARAEQTAQLYLEANRKNAALFDRYRAEAERNAAISAARERKARAEAKLLGDMYAKVINAPESDDGPVAPVLRDAARGLLELGAGDPVPAR